MSRSFRLLAAAAVMSVAALGATKANAGGLHSGGFHGGGFGHHHHGYWGGPRYGWGGLNVGYYGDSGCYVKRYVNRFGEIVARTVCY